MEIPHSPSRTGGFLRGFFYGAVLSIVALVALSLIYPVGAQIQSDGPPQLLPVDTAPTTPVPSNTDNAVLPSATVPELQQIARATGRDPSAPRAPDADLSPSGPRLAPSGSLSPVADGGPVRLGRSSGGGSTILRNDADLPRRSQTNPSQGQIAVDPTDFDQGVALDTTSAAVPVVDDGTARAPQGALAAGGVPQAQTPSAERPQTAPVAAQPAQTPTPVATASAEQVATGPAPQVAAAQAARLGNGEAAEAPRVDAPTAQPTRSERAPQNPPAPVELATAGIGPAVPAQAAQSAPTPRAPDAVPSLSLAENPETLETEVTLGAGIRASQPKNKKAMAAEVQRRVDAAQKREQQIAGATPGPIRSAAATPQGAGPSLGAEQTTYLNTLPVQTLNYGTAFRTNRIPFTAPDDRPLLSIILVDIGSEGVSRDALRALQVPVTFAVEANMVGAADVSRNYRALGFETLAMMPSVGDLVFDKGDAAFDLDRNIGALLGAVPAAVGLVDRIDGPLPLDANLTRSTLAALQVTGHGLITHRSRGLNQVDRQARSVGVPSAAITRVIDARPGKQSVRVALDRAVLDASKLGASVVIGRTDTETTTALMSWILGPGGKSVLLAPVSASIERLSR